MSGKTSAEPVQPDVSDYTGTLVVMIRWIEK